MKIFDKEFVLEMLTKEKEFKSGDTIEFTKPSSNGVIWIYKIIRESERYLPFAFILEGKSSERSPAGTYACHNRRYESLNQLFTHLLNNYNDNANMKKKYCNVEQYLFG